MEHVLKLAPGLRGEQSVMVSAANTALAMGSGDLEVFATPAMAALMEAAAVSSLKDCLPGDSSTVGTALCIKHLSATPPGLLVRASALLREVDGRTLRFHVEAYDDAGLIGEGSHERFIINIEKFMARTEAKKTAKP